MRLVNAAKVIKKSIYIFFGLIFITYTITEGGPSLMKEFFPPAPVERPILFKFNPIVFSAVKDYPSGENGIDISNAKVIYRRNPVTDWNSLNKKTAKIYKINLNIPEDIDYLLTAKSVASFLGYDDTNLISTGSSDDNYIWEVPEDKIRFIINKKNKKMEQKSSIARLKNYLTAGEFVNAEFVSKKVQDFLTSSKKFTSEEVNTSDSETTFLRFEGDNLISSPVLGSELAFVKVYTFLDGKRIVGNNYEKPSNFMYVASLRPEISQIKKNYRYPRFNLYRNELVSTFNNEEFDLNPLPNVVDRVVNNRDFVVRGITFNDIPHDSPNKPTNFKIDNISIESFEVAYFDDYEEGFGKNPLVQPIYLFRGNFDTSTGQRGKIILYTPAINPKYYN